MALGGGFTIGQDTGSVGVFKKRKRTSSPLVASGSIPCMSFGGAIYRKTTARTGVCHEAGTTKLTKNNILQWMAKKTSVPQINEEGIFLYDFQSDPRQYGRTLAMKRCKRVCSFKNKTNTLIPLEYLRFIHQHVRKGTYIRCSGGYSNLGIPQQQ